MNYKPYFYSFVSFLVASSFHVLLGTYYIFLAPIIEETGKYYSSLFSRDRVSIVATYALFGFFEYVAYFFLTPTYEIAVSRLYPFFFHIATGVIVALFPRNKRHFSLIVNIAFHYLVIIYEWKSL